MSSEPLVSIVILNYNKRDLLRRCIESALGLDWPNLECIVVDNASSDGSADMVDEVFPRRVQVIRRLENSVTGGRNDGFRVARGEFVLSLDNDILLPDKSIVRKALDLFAAHPRTGLLACLIGDPDDPSRYLSEHWWHPVPIDEGARRFFYTTYFPEAAAFFRTEALRATGGYDETYFMGVEQSDLALKLIREGYLMLYCPTLTTVEEAVRGQLALRKSRIHYLNMRNKLWTAWKHYPVGRGLVFAGSRVAASAVRSVRHGWTGYFLKGLRDGVLAPESIRSQRRPLGREAWAVYDRIQRGWFADEPD